MARFLLLLAAAFLPAAQAWADMASSIARIKASIVIVGTYSAIESPRFRLRGTGFAVGNGNLVVTNVHVLPDARDNRAEQDLVVQVRGSGLELEMRRASVVEMDSVHDLALLRIDGAALPVLQVRGSDAVREGQSVAFMGFPIGGALGFSPVTHRGMVSSITPFVQPVPAARQLNEAAVRSMRAGSFDIFQLDGTAYPGNSGGPLFDPDTGDVLGVVNMVFIKGARESALSQPSGISYAIPSRHVLELITRAQRK